MNQGEIKWLPLRLNIIPLLDRQAKVVLQTYLSTRKEILGGDILSIQKYNSIRQEVSQRLREIDAFYLKNAMDPRMKYLYSSKCLLAKIIDQPNQFEKINEYNFNSEQNEIISNTPAKDNIKSNFGNSPNLTQRKPTTPNQASQTSKEVTSRSPFDFNGKNSKNLQYDKEDGIMRLSDLKREKNPKGKSPLRKFREEPQKILQKGSSRKIQPGSSKRALIKKNQPILQLQREKNEVSSRLQNNGYDINKSFKDLSELVFTIKMTKQQYNQFMRMKRDNHHG